MRLENVKEFEIAPLDAARIMKIIARRVQSGDLTADFAIMDRAEGEESILLSVTDTDGQTLQIIAR